MTLTRRRWLFFVLAVAIIGVAAASIRAVRERILSAAGWALVSDAPAEPADVIIVAVDAGRAGVLEASDLVHSGISTRVAVFSDAPDLVDAELSRRGIPYQNAAERSERLLRLLGVTSIQRIPRTVAGTVDEGLVLPVWCDQHQFRSIIVVSTSDHSRRLSRVLRRSMNGRSIRVTVRAARYSAFDRRRWWATRSGIRTEIVELEKLLLDVLQYPFS